MNKLMKKHRENNKGFSLVELIVVIAIMAVLIGVIAPQFLGYTAKAKKSTDVQNAQMIAEEIAVTIADADAVTEVAAWTEVTTAVVNSVPEVKLVTTDKFYYKISADGDITVGIGDGTDAATVTVYPTIDAGSDYE